MIVRQVGNLAINNPAIIAYRISKSIPYTFCIIFIVTLFSPTLKWPFKLCALRKRGCHDLDLTRCLIQS